MRFGKRLAELQTQSGQLSQPYISYKELKHLLGDLRSLISSAGSDSRREPFSSSGDEAPPFSRKGSATSAPLDVDSCSVPAASSSSTAGCSGSQLSARSQLEAQQRSFFNRIDNDVSMTFSHVMSVIASLEAGIGDWQGQAIACGLLFTPEQLQDTADELPFDVDQQVLVEWLVDLQQAEQVRGARQTLAENYSAIASTLQVLLQYIEVNITAVRKILKKFEKKVPAEFRVQSAQSCVVHHKLFTSELQDLLVAVVHMHRLVIDMKSSNLELDVRRTLASPISFLGPETLQVLQRVLVCTDLHNLLAPARLENVYEKPNSNVRGAGAAINMIRGNGAASLRPASDVGQSGGNFPAMSQQVAFNLNNAEMFQGPPRDHQGSHSAASAASNLPKSMAKDGKTGGLPAHPHTSFPKPSNVTGGKTAAAGCHGGRGGQAGQAATRGGGRRGKGNHGPRASGGQPTQQNNGSRENQGGAHPDASDSRSNHVAVTNNGRHHGKAMNKGHGQNGQHSIHRGGTGANADMNNMQCMVMMVPAGWGQDGKAVAAPPGSLKGSGHQLPWNGKGGKGSGYGGVQMMGMVPNMDASYMNDWRAMMLQQTEMRSQQQQQQLGYPQGMMQDHFSPQGMGNYLSCNPTLP